MLGIERQRAGDWWDGQGLWEKHFNQAVAAAAGAVMPVRGPR